MPLHPQGGTWKTRWKFVVSSDTTRNYMPESKMADVSGHLEKQSKLLQFSSPPHFSGCCAKSSPIDPKCHSVDGGLLLPDDRGIVAGAVTSPSMWPWRHIEVLPSPSYRFPVRVLGSPQNALGWPFSRLVSSSCSLRRLFRAPANFRNCVPPAQCIASQHPPHPGSTEARRRKLPSAGCEYVVRVVRSPGSSARIWRSIDIS
ncbi:hypothetical protein GE09DRAFT_499175 [Coniochaeta sp. 2T2.1]|nr:hypothetical protein GE09DRAFT_499175 [Coniochaeta sp. 2T2.1]